MGRKYANKIKWKKALRTEYKSIYYEEGAFKGYLACIKFLEVKEPLIKEYFSRKIVTADKEYIWLEIFPLDRNYCITAKYNERKQIVKWYIDIVSSVGLEDGVPYMEDMYLDLDLMPTGEMEVLDEDELEEALKKGDIGYKDYLASQKAMEDFIDQLDIDRLIKFSNTCLDRLNI